jgi:hypothetical protein
MHIFVSKVGAKIIDERFHAWTGAGRKPESPPSIPSLDIGGTAGGTKFVVGGVLFKLATDPKIGGRYLYGGVQHRTHFLRKTRSLKAHNKMARSIDLPPR